MQYLLILYSDETRWPTLGDAEQQRWTTEYGAFTEALRKADALRGLGRLQPTTTASTVRVADGRAEVLDGPYIESKEQLAGYFLIDVPDRAAALDWAARCPAARHGTIEVRPLRG